MGNTLLSVRTRSASGAVVSANGQFVSGNFFKTFGVTTSRGRLLTDGDDDKGAWTRVMPGLFETLGTTIVLSIQ